MRTFAQSCRPAYLVLAASALTAIFLALGVSALSAAPATAPFVVSSPADAVDAIPGDGLCATAGGACTLRAAIQEANALPGIDSIMLPPGIYSFTLAGRNEDNAATGDLDVHDSVVISGAGADLTIIDGNGLDRLLDLGAASVVISDLTLRNGNVFPPDVGQGGAIRSNSVLQLNRVHLSGSVASECGGAITNGGTVLINASSITSNTAGSCGGGAIRSFGVLVITDSLIANNTSPSPGGGIAIHGGVLTTTNVTLSGNTSTGFQGGGGVYNLSGRVIFLNSTLRGNSAVYGGGNVYNYNAFVAFKNTIASDGIPDNCGGDANITSWGHNLESGDTCGFIDPTDRINSNPHLGPLANHGGPTPTYPLLANSPALDSADRSDCPSHDQRGVPRPQGSDCDRGAFEFEQADLSVSQTDWPDPVLPGHLLTYTVIVTNAGALTATETVLTDTFPLSVTSDSIASSQGICLGSSQVVCTLGSITANSPATITIVVSTTALGMVTNTVVVTGSAFERNMTNNAATEQTAVNAADLSVSQSGAPDRVLVGQIVTYTINLTNYGPSTATNVVLTSTLPVTAHLKSVLTTQGICGGNNMTVCQLGIMASGDALTVTLVVTPTASGVVSSMVSVTGNEADPLTANNTNTQDSTVVPYELYLPFVARGS